MEVVGVRELQQHASAVLRRVRGGETVGVTDRGALIAVLAPPSAVGGAAALMAAGRVRAATRHVTDLPPAQARDTATAAVLADLRAER